MAYSEKVIDHYENPRNVGSFEKNAEGVGTGMVGAPAGGGVMKLQMKVGKVGLIGFDRQSSMPASMPASMAGAVTVVNETFAERFFDRPRVPLVVPQDLDGDGHALEIEIVSRVEDCEARSVTLAVVPAERPKLYIVPR